MTDRDYGMARGKVFPAAQAKSLLNPLRRLLQSPARTVAVLDVATDATVLELGSGPGWFSPHLAGLVPDGALLVADLQPAMLVLARERVRAAGFVGADAMALPLASDRLDGAFVATMLGEVPDRDVCIGVVRRVLRRGGILAVAETRRDSDFIPLDDLRALVERHGFAFDRSSGIRWQYVARFRAV